MPDEQEYDEDSYDDKVVILQAFIFKLNFFDSNIILCLKRP